MESNKDRKYNKELVIVKFCKINKLGVLIRSRGLGKIERLISKGGALLHTSE